MATLAALRSVIGEMMVPECIGVGLFVSGDFKILLTGPVTQLVVEFLERDPRLLTLLFDKRYVDMKQWAHFVPLASVSMGTGLLHRQQW